MIDRLEAWFLKYILRIRNPIDDSDWEPVEAEDIPWDVPLDQTVGKIHVFGVGDVPADYFRR